VIQQTGAGYFDADIVVDQDLEYETNAIID
jgi:hypothetical protein